MKKKIVIAHSADADDAFMFYPLACDIISANDFIIEHHISDIEDLNQQAFQSRFEITAISFNAYSKLTDRYDLLPCGASFGINYGPIIISNEKLSIKSLKETKVAVPGINTTAFLLMSHYINNFSFEIVPFDQIIPSIIEGIYKAGLIIHEGQLTYKQLKLFKIVDLGNLWFSDTNLPLPLGGLAIKKSIDKNDKIKLSNLIKQSIKYSLDNFEAAFQYALKYSRNSSPKLIKNFIKMYVNELSIDYSEIGRKSLEAFSRKFLLPEDLSKYILSI
jgi:1,4-dihydroxy-6-naphthoate synthase